MRMPRWAGRIGRRAVVSKRSLPESAALLELSLVRLEDRRVLDATGVLVADLNPGDFSSSPAGFTDFNGQLYFSAEGENAAGESVGRELYRLDESGQTSLAADINHGEGSSNPEGFTEFENALYFSATGSTGRELYRLDADGAVTRVADINPGAAGSNPTGFTAFDGSLYFAATSSQGRELFRLDASQQVQQVQDINAGSASSNPEGFTEFNGKLYFAATGAGGREAYVLNRGGSANQIKDVNPGKASSNPADFTVFNNALYFSATNAYGRTLYRQSASGVNPVAVLDFDVVTNPTNLTPFGDHLYFRGDNLHGGSELFTLDRNECLTEIGTSDGRPLLSPSVFAVYNGTLYFAATTDQSFGTFRVFQNVAQTRGLYRLEMNGAEAIAVSIELPDGVALESDEPSEFLEFPQHQGDLYFAAAAATGQELYRVNRLDQVERVLDLYPGYRGSNPEEFVSYRDNFYFSAQTAQTGRELFRLALESTTIAIVNGELRLTDAAGDQDNRLIISSDGVSLTIRDENGHDIFGTIAGMTGGGTNQLVIPLASLVGIHRLAVDMRGGDDSFTWNGAQSAVSLLRQFTHIRVDGGANSKVESDFMRFVGDQTLTAVYLPDASSSDAGKIEISNGVRTTTIRFSDSEGVDVTKMYRAVFLAPESCTGADELFLTSGKDALDGTRDAIVVSGTSSGAAFEQVRFFANGRVEINAGDNGDGRDVIELLGVGGLHANGDLYLSTAATSGIASDVVKIAGDLALAGQFRVTTDRIEINGAVRAGGEVRLSAQESVVFFESAALALTGHANIFVDADADDRGFEPIVMHEGATITADLGAIEFRAGGDIFLSDLRTHGAVVLTSTHGAILDLADNGALDLTAARAHLVSAHGVGTAHNPLETRIAELRDANRGGLWIANERALLVHFIQSSGPLSIENQGTITIVGGVQSTGGAITLATTGDLILGSASLINPQLGAAGVTLTSAGAIAMADGSYIDAIGGPISIAASGDVQISEVRTKGDADITSTRGAILDLADNGALDLTAATAHLQAAIGIGTAGNPLETRLGQLTAASGGGLWMANDRSLLLHSVQTVSALSINNFGTLRIAGAVQGGGGPISLTASSDLALALSASIDAQSGDAGIMLVSGGAIAMTDGSWIDAVAGQIVITASGNLLLSEVRTQGNAVLTSTCGAILDLADNGALDLAAATAHLQAALGIGTAENPLETRIGQLTATSGGGLWITNATAMTIEKVEARGDVVLKVVGDATVAGSILVSCDGQLLLDVLGTLHIDAPLTTYHGDMRLLASESIFVSATVLRSEAGDIEFIADRDGNGTGTLRIAADIFAGAGDTFFSLAGLDGQFSGSLQGDGALVKQGAGTLELTSSSHNTYSGATNILAGTLIVNGVIGAHAASGLVTISGGATLSGGGDVFAPIFATATTAQIITTGNLRLGDGSTAGMQFAGQFLIGVGQIVVLRDANFAEVGVLTSLGQSATLVAAGGVQVPGGGRLSGNGAIEGPLKVLFGGVASPGDNVGILSTQNLEFLTGAEIRVDVNGIVAGASHDQFRVNGAVALQGATLVLSSLTFNAANGTVLVLISNDGFDAVSGRFINASGATLNEGAVIRVGQYDATLSYSGGVGGNDVTLTLGRQVFFALPGIATSATNSSPGARNADATAAAFVFYVTQVAAAGVNADVETTPLTAAPDAQSSGKADSLRIRGAARDELSTRIEQRFRLYFRVYFDALAREGEQEYDLSPDDLRNLTAVFRRFRFPNGHFKVYLQEFGSKSERLILDVQVYDGRVVTEPLQEDENESQLKSQPRVQPNEAASDAQQDDTDQPATESLQKPESSLAPAVSPAALLLMSALRRRCRTEAQETARIRRPEFSRFSHLLRRQNPK